MVAPPGTALDGDVIVAGADIAVGDGYVSSSVAGVDAVGVAGETLRRVDLDAPDREAVAMVVDDVEVGRVLERDAIQGEVVRVVGHDEARNLLPASGTRLLG